MRLLITVPAIGGDLSFKGQCAVNINKLHAFRADVGGPQSCHICRNHFFTKLSFTAAQGTTFAVSLLVPANAVTALANQ